jgi:hypothetical protein
MAKKQTAESMGFPSSGSNARDNKPVVRRIVKGVASSAGEPGSEGIHAAVRATVGIPVEWVHVDPPSICRTTSRRGLATSRTRTGTM